MSDRLSLTLSALADPTRRAILARLASGEATVGELAEPFEMSLPAVSKHLKVLERAGLIARGRAAQWRPCRLEAAPLREVAEWVERYRRYWEERLDRLEAYLEQMQREGEMTNGGDGDGREVVVTRSFAASAEAVFDAWLDPAAAGGWLFRTPAGRLVACEIDPRVGGGFRIVEDRAGEMAEHVGSYVEIDRPRRLAFDFRADPAERPTRVTIEIVPEAGGCRLTLTHVVAPEWAGFTGQVREGWTMILAGLAAHIDQTTGGSTS